MNDGGVPYAISNPDPTSGEYLADFDEATTEHFDVYGEVQTRYSQVYWTRNAPVPLPADIVKRFDGKVMAITGYEIDQVVKTPEGDKSIPIYNAYNHHYFGWLTGKDSEMYDADEVSTVPNPTKTAFRDLPNSHGFPTNIVFKENPGGEYRKSYHAYPRGYAQLIHSPNEFVVEPMQIDTHNRNYSITDEVGLKPSFLPKADDYTHSFNDPGSHLSPLIECPCGTRITRSVTKTYEILTQGVCQSSISSTSDCEAAVANVASVVASVTVNNASQPAGCLMAPDPSGKSYTAIFNTAKESKETCGEDTPSGPFAWDGPYADTAIACEDSGCLPPSSDYGCTGELAGQCTWDSVESAKENCGKYHACEAFFCSTHFASKLLCFGRATSSGDSVKKGYGSADITWKKKYDHRPASESLQGHSSSLVNVTVSHDGETATVTMVGPAGVWFGVGFGAQAMSNLPYALIVDGEGQVSERKLVDHGPGALLAPSVVVSSSAASGGIRTVVLTRAVAGKTANHFSFPAQPGVMNIIVAVGKGSVFAYHKARTGAQLTLVPSKVRSCLCAPKSTTSLTYMNESTAVYNVNCAAEPRSDMAQHHNPACQMQTYHGGLHCCHHLWFLTDLEQDSMVPAAVDTYYLKWRFYFQEYVPASAGQKASHKHIHHWVFLIDQAVNDYEDVQCQAGTMCRGTITARLTARDMGLEDTPVNFSGIIPIVMTPHCHAPNCLREEIYNDDTGELICGVTGRYGNGTEVFNEANYLAIPPCLFGHQPGLQKPWTITPETNLRAVKYYNSSFRHPGQMAQWTGLMIYDTDPFADSFFAKPQQPAVSEMLV